ncbi:YALIA101S10e00562g1_1 [Yarrowia lipolytica]|nr:Putative MFS-type transporter [Yarrowia lipolytica]SEI36096.1 YALIA101S10e00562g1_1 [Yarrowia lipolytica]
MSSLEPPGTVVLETSSDSIVLQPAPSCDPNQPLNWARWRKHLNFFIVCFFTLIAFTASDVSSVLWGPWQAEFGWTFSELNNTYAISVAGLGLGCPILVPFSHKFGKRPVYLVASALVVATAAWQAGMNSIGEAYGSQFLQGLAVSVTETIIQMTVADLYFVHERGTFNGIYMLVVAVGNFIVLVPAGYATVNLGWRWVYIIVAIIAAVQFVMTVFFFEETNYTAPDVVLVSTDLSDMSETEQAETDEQKMGQLEKTGSDKSPPEKAVREVFIDPEIQMNPLSKRLALVTYNPGSFKEFVRKLFTPFLTLVSYPIVSFSALQYGFLLSFLSMASTTVSNSFADPPYNFSSAGIGNVNISPFIGCLFGCIYGGWFNDKTIIWLSKRNNGVYEPEFRLYSLVFANFTMTIGMFMFGISIANHVHWMVPTVGFAVVAFSFGSAGAIIVTYLVDCYEKIVADAFIGVIVIRNGLAMMILFCMSPWVDSIGLQNTYVSAGCLSLIPVILTVPMIIYGKELRRRSASRYLRESLRG